MDNVKLSVTFELPGGTLVSSQECEKNPKLLEKMVVTYPVKKRDGKKTYYSKETLVVPVRKCRPASQVINMNSDAYQAMLDSAPEGFYGKWKNIPKEEKLVIHLNRVKQDLGAKSFVYSVLDD